MKVISEYDVENQSLKEVFADPEWRGEAPLWFYILKEAEMSARAARWAPSAGGLWPRSLSVCCRRTLTPTCT